MGQKPDNNVKLSDTLCLSEFKTGGSKGFWLWDETREMNLSMRAPSERDALVEALEYYQERLSELESKYSDLAKSVSDFVQKVTGDDCGCGCGET